MQIIIYISFLIKNFLRIITNISVFPGNNIIIFYIYALVA